MIVFATQDFVLAPEICEVRTVSRGFVACCANRTTDCGQIVGPVAMIGLDVRGDYGLYSLFTLFVRSVGSARG
jgi:hypothetical protein